MECPNHPYRKKYPGYPNTHWAPLLPFVCAIVDKLTRGKAHD